MSFKSDENNKVIANYIMDNETTTEEIIDEEQEESRREEQQEEEFDEDNIIIGPDYINDALKFPGGLGIN